MSYPGIFYSTCVALVLCGCCGSPLASAADSAEIRIILVGDSTMATRTGYGDALCSLLKANVTCINLAKGGRSSGSYRTEGSWKRVAELLRVSEPFERTYVLIQFGHNDQPGKPGRSTDLASEFPVNIARYVDDVREFGAIPVLVTPLTRRIFREGVLKNDLEPWAGATRTVAATKGTPVIELNARSATLIGAMGSPEADTLAEVPPPSNSFATSDANIAKVPLVNGVQGKFDYTHLGPKGALLFARIVADELVQAEPAIAAHIKIDKPAR